MGDQKGVFVVAGMDFIESLGDANILACAYGFEKVSGYPMPMPCITLVGEHIEPLRRAFGSFDRWGCKEDGDVVNIQLMLKNNGTYVMAISPEIDRALNRLAPHHQLLRPLLVGMSWVKRFDTTNPMLPKISDYVRSPLTPVLISGGTADFSRNPPPLDSLQPVTDLPRLVKFSLNILYEKDDPNHWLLQELKKGRKADPKSNDPISNPKECAKLRRQTIDVAFPVSRERIRRANIVDAVRRTDGFPDVGRDQIEQAAINLVLSAEVANGKCHFAGLGSNLRDIVWKHILNRVEGVDQENRIGVVDPALVAYQIKLDVTAVLARRGIPTKRKGFRTLQSEYRREGYIGD